MYLVLLMSRLVTDFDELGRDQSVTLDKVLGIFRQANLTNLT